MHFICQLCFDQNGVNMKKNQLPAWLPWEGTEHWVQHLINLVQINLHDHKIQTQSHKVAR